MGVVAGALATVLVGFLLFVQPRRGKRRFEQLKLDVQTDPTARFRFYRRGIIAKWIMTAVVFAIGLLAMGAGHDVGLPPPSGGESRSMAWIVTVEAMILVPISAVVLRSRKPRIVRLVQRQIGHLQAMLPVTRQERMTFVGVAFSAGICEEVVFRWFGITYVRWLAPESSNLLVIVVIGASFGLAHLYQGKWGVLGTGAAGAAFTWLTLVSGSLLPAIVIHTLIDLRIITLRQVADPAVGPERAHLPAPPA